MMLLIFSTGCTTIKSFPPDIVPKQGIVVVEVGASWCSYCRAARPIIDEAQHNLGFFLINIDVDKDPELIKNYSKHFTFTGIPSITIYKNGKILYHGSWPGKDDFYDMIPRSKTKETNNG